MGACRLLLEEGELDMMGIMSSTEERGKIINFIGPHFFKKMRVIIPESRNYEISKHEDLLNLPGKIAMIKGTWLGKEMEALLQLDAFKKKIIWTGTNDVDSIIEKIRIGRVSAYIGPDMAVGHGRYKGLKYHPFIITAEPVYFGFSIKSVDQSLLAKLQSAFERVKAKGEFEKISIKYDSPVQ